MHMCIHITMMVLCRQKLRFPKHGRSQVKKVLRFHIWYDHHMGFTSRGGSPHKFTRASIEAWRMLWHFSRNGSCGWLRYWGKGYVCREVSSARITSREIKYGNSNSGTFELQQYHCRSLPYGEHIILLEYQYILFCWMKGTTTRLKVYLR